MPDKFNMSLFPQAANYNTGVPGVTGKSYIETEPNMTPADEQAYREQQAREAAQIPTTNPVASTVGTLGMSSLLDKIPSLGQVTGALSEVPNALGQIVSNPSAFWTGLTGAANMTPIDAGAAAAQELGSSIAPAFPYVAGPLGAYGLYNLFSSDKQPGRSFGESAMGAGQGALSGAALGSVIPGIGTGIGAIIGGLGGLIHSMTGSTKSEDQLKRDDWRKQQQQTGLVDPNYGVTLANGTSFDIGRDGSLKLRQVNNADYPLVSKIVGLANVVGFLTSPGDKKLAQEMTGYLTNAAMSNASNYDEAMSNILAFINKIGIGPGDARQILEAARAQGILTPEEYTAYQGAMISMIEGNPDQYENSTAMEGATGAPVNAPWGPTKEDRTPGPLSPAAPAPAPAQAQTAPQAGKLLWFPASSSQPQSNATPVRVAAALAPQPKPQTPTDTPKPPQNFLGRSPRGEQAFGAQAGQQQSMTNLLRRGATFMDLMREGVRNARSNV